MPYQINKFNGDRLVVLEDGTLDSTTSIGLVGKNFAGYGEIQNENMLWMLENFAGDGAPPKPIVGQLWYDSVAQRIRVYTGSDWKIVGNTEVSANQPIDVASGDGWLDTSNNQFYVYDGSQFRFVGPEAAQGFGVTRSVSARVQDSSGNYVPVIKLTLNDAVIAVIADQAFTLNSATPIPGFVSLVKGINLVSNAIISGNVSGNSTTASSLENSVQINGVAFDGSQNITITSATSENLQPGNFLVGNTFDGSTQQTWSVNATSLDDSNTIVSRDSLGNFSAGTITADVVGNITGTHNGPVVGNVTGNLLGNVTGNVTGILTGTVNGNVVGTVTGNVTGSIKGDLINQDNTIAYDSIGKVFTASLNGNATSASRLQTPVTINGVSFDGGTSVTVFDQTKLPLTGGVLTGSLTLNADPTQNLQPATKQYVDGKDAAVYANVFANLPPPYTITSGFNYSSSSYTNIVGGFSNGANFFDVFPPSGKTMSDLVAFLPSIAYIHYAGRVDGNDSLRCIWVNQGDRIRVYVQNTEQRSTPAANWIAIWR